MSKQLHITHAVAVSAMVLAFSSSAHAAANRTFVATTGTDSNTSVNCGATTPCRTFTAALSVTNSAGEVVVLDSGGYGSFSITQSVLISAIGVDASITEPGLNAITIATTGNVTINGLNLSGGPNNIGDGLYVSEIGFLRLYNMQIQGFGNIGIEFLPITGRLALLDSKVNDCHLGGLVLDGGAGVQAYVHNTDFDNDSEGAMVAYGELEMVDSSVRNNTSNGISVGYGVAALYNDRISFNSVGVSVFQTGTVYIGGSFVYANNVGLSVGPGGKLSSSSPGTNLITPGQGTYGTLSTPVALQ